MIHAYRLQIQLDPAVDVSRAQFKAALVIGRKRMRALVRRFGDDPLPRSSVDTQINVRDKAITVEWRSRVGPEREDLVELIRDHAGRFPRFATWRVQYHHCRNGQRKACGDWRTLLES